MEIANRAFIQRHLKGELSAKVPKGHEKYIKSSTVAS